MRLYCILLYVFILSGLHAQQAENREYRKNQTFIGNDSDIMVVSHRADWRHYKVYKTVLIWELTWWK